MGHVLVRRQRPEHRQPGHQFIHHRIDSRKPPYWTHGLASKTCQAASPPPSPPRAWPRSPCSTPRSRSCPTSRTSSSLTPAEASLTISAATGALALAVIPMAALADRIGRRRVIVWSVLTAAALGLLLPLTPTYETLLAARALQGIATAGVPATAMAFLAQEAPKTHVGAAIGALVAGNSAGGMLGRLITGFTTDGTSWRIALALAGAFGAAARSPPPSSCPRATPPNAARARSQDALTDRVLLCQYAIAILAVAAFISVFNVIGFRLTTDLGLPPASPPWSSSPTRRAAARRTAAGRLADRHGRARITLAGLAWPPPAPRSPSPTTWPRSPSASPCSPAASSPPTRWRAAGSARAHPGTSSGQASGVYLFAFYVGSSTGGTAGSAAYQAHGWPGLVVLITVWLALAAVAVAPHNGLRSRAAPRPPRRRPPRPSPNWGNVTVPAATGTSPTARPPAPRTPPPPGTCRRRNARRPAAPPARPAASTVSSADVCPAPPRSAARARPAATPPTPSRDRPSPTRTARPTTPAAAAPTARARPPPTRPSHPPTPASTPRSPPAPARAAAPRRVTDDRPRRHLDPLLAATSPPRCRAPATPARRRPAPCRRSAPTRCPAAGRRAAGAAAPARPATAPAAAAATRATASARTPSRPRVPRHPHPQHPQRHPVLGPQVTLRRRPHGRRRVAGHVHFELVVADHRGRRVEHLAVVGQHAPGSPAPPRRRAGRRRSPGRRCAPACPTGVLREPCGGTCGGCTSSRIPAASALDLLQRHRHPVGGRGRARHLHGTAPQPRVDLERLTGAGEPAAHRVPAARGRRSRTTACSSTRPRPAPADRARPAPPCPRWSTSTCSR